MTKARPPLSIGQAVMLVAGVLGYDEMEALIGVGQRQIRNFSDPDHIAEISLKDAIALDIAFSAAGGVGYPFLHCFEHQLEIERAPRSADARAIAEQAALAAKEHGDANAAIIKTVLPDATAADRAIAKRELGLAIAADQNTLALLESDDPPSRESG